MVGELAQWIPPREWMAGTIHSCFLLPGCQVFMWPCPLPTANWLKGGEGTCPKLIQWVLSPRIFGPETERELKQTLFGVWGCENIKLRCCLQSCFRSCELEDWLEAAALLRKKNDTQRGTETRQRGWWCLNLWFHIVSESQLQSCSWVPIDPCSKRAIDSKGPLFLKSIFRCKLFWVSTAHNQGTYLLQLSRLKMGDLK